MEHQTRGPLAGPYKKLPASSSSRLRLLALDVAGTLLGLRSQEKDLEGLVKAVGLAVAGEEEQGYWIRVSSSALLKQ